MTHTWFIFHTVSETDLISVLTETERPTMVIKVHEFVEWIQSYSQFCCQTNKSCSETVKLKLPLCCTFVFLCSSTNFAIYNATISKFSSIFFACRQLFGLTLVLYTFYSCGKILKMYSKHLMLLHISHIV